MCWKVNAGCALSCVTFQNNQAHPQYHCTPNTVSSWGEYALNGVVNALEESSSLRGTDGIPRLGGHHVYHTEVSKTQTKLISTWLPEETSL